MNNCYMYVTHHYLLGSLLIGTGYALYMTPRYSLILAMLSTWLAATHWAFLCSLHDLPLFVGTCYTLYITRWDLLLSLHYSLGLATLFMWLVANHRNLLRSSRDLLLFIGTLGWNVSLGFTIICAIAQKFSMFMCSFHTKFHGYITQYHHDHNQNSFSRL